MRQLLVLLPLLGACGHGGDDPIRLRASVMRPPHDTIRFELPATATRCEDRRSLLLEGLSPEGNGVLVWVRYGDSLSAGTYRVTVMDDTTEHNAKVAVRYIVRQVTHAFALDSGVVDVRASVGTISAHVLGRGVENATLVSAVADYRDVPIAQQSTPCQRQP